jgi:hypothetical protein
MLRYLTAAVLPVALFLLIPVPASGQGRVPPARSRHVVHDRIAGTYQNVSGGGTCFVYNRIESYLFVNERGDQAEFAYVAPRRLRMISGDWDPNIVVTVSSDAQGRTVLRFDAPRTPTGYWVQMP